MSVRLLHVHSTFASTAASAMRAVRLMNAFAEMADHDIICATPGEMSARDHVARTVKAVFPEAAPPLSGRASLARLFRLSRFARNYDLVLTYGPLVFDMMLARHLFGGPRLVHHEDGGSYHAADPVNHPHNLYRRLGLSSAYRLIVTSRRLERIACSSWGQSRERVVRIADGVPVETYGRAAAEEGVAGLPPRAGDLVVGTLARLLPSSNLTRLVRAVAAMKVRNVQLIIAGEGPESEHIMNEARRCGIANRFILPGKLDPVSVLSRLDVFASACAGEQFPMPLVEAMAAGLPIAATAAGEVAETVAADNLPLIVAPDDEIALAAALDTLADRADLRRAIGRANLEKARAEFDEKNMFSAYARLYEEAIGAPHRLVAASA